MFIKLTLAYSKKPIYINTRHIVSISTGGNERGTFIHCTSTKVAYSTEVMETPEEILATIPGDKE